MQKHLRDGWSIFNPELGEYITPVPPQMRTGERWYGGTADAIYQNLYLVERSGAKWVAILSGDHIYRMDYSVMLEFHRTQRSDLTVACMEVGLDEAQAFGIMETDAEDRVIGFAEKPADPRPLPGDPKRTLASMGIYVFSTELLLQVLREDQRRVDSSHDFGRDIIPRLLGSHRVLAYRFGGALGRVTPDRYWRDVGTIDAYYRANMDLLEPVPPMNLYQPDWPIRTYQGQHPPARTVPGASGNEGLCINSIIASGAVIAGGSVQHSILFGRVYVGDEAVIEDSVLFEGVQVGDGAHLKGCIVDKYVNIPPGTRIGFDRALDAARFTLSERGIIVVPKGYQFT